VLSGNALTLCADKALYLGEIPATGWHRHAAPVLLLGLSGRFRLLLPAGRVETCHSALVDAGVEHVFDPQGERVALMYLEPDAPEVRRLRPVFARQGPVIGEPVPRSVSRWHTEQRLHSFDLPALLGRAGLPELQPVDPRVLRSLQRLREAGEGVPDRDALARSAHLSASRFNHLFSDELGVSFRSYRIWTQVRRAMAAYRPDGSLTEAALDGAFADSAHFSRMFRHTFGMTPSSVLRPLRAVNLLG
jgi:AraC-like DNA-binding protein